MSKGRPQSVTAYSAYLSIPEFAFKSILKNGYPHKKLKTINLKAKTQNDNEFSYSGNTAVSYDDQNKAKFATQDTIKFEFFLFKNIFLQQRFKRSNEIRYHVDFGNFNIFGKDINFFGNVKSNFTLDRFWSRLGFNYITDCFKLSQRFEHDYAGNIQLSGRTIYKRGKLTFGFIDILNLENQKLNKYDCFANYQCCKFDVTLQHLTPKKSNDEYSLGRFILGLAYTLNDKMKFALTGKFDMEEEDYRVVVGNETKVNKDVTVKAKIDHRGKLSGAAKFQFHQNCSATVGTQLNFSKGTDFINFNHLIPLPFGLTFDVTI